MKQLMISSSFRTMRLFAGLTLIIVLSSCRGQPFTQSPIHINPNMDWQPKFEAQEANHFFENNSAMRTPVEGTVARGFLTTNSELNFGKDDKDNFVKTMPVTMDKALLKRGQERYNIYCAPCHGGVGDGKGVIITYGYVPPPSFHEDRIVNVEDGYLYDVIYNGIRSMPSYRHQVPLEDRWAIVGYIRALQKSQNASESDLKKLGYNKDEVASSK